MRIVPDDEQHEEPAIEVIEVREPDPRGR